MEMNWSRWFRCESSFGLLLVPSQPGIFALAEEVAQTVGAQQRRMLAVFEVAEADDLSRAMSRLFAAGSPVAGKDGGSQDLCALCHCAQHCRSKGSSHGAEKLAERAEGSSVTDI